MKIDGDIAYTDKFGKRHTIEGYGTLPDETELKSLKVDGSISFDKISCGNFKVSGDCFGSSLTAEKISVDGDIEVNDIKAVEDLKIYGDCVADLLTANKIFIDGDIKADGIKVAESLNIEGEPQINSIESDKIVINAQSGTIEEIKCRDLKIFNNGVNFEGEISIGKFRITSSPKQNFSQVISSALYPFRPFRPFSPFLWQFYRHINAEGAKSPFVLFVAYVTHISERLMNCPPF